jgi:hypothetical protein
MKKQVVGDIIIYTPEDQQDQVIIKQMADRGQIDTRLSFGDRRAPVPYTGPVRLTGDWR